MNLSSQRLQQLLKKDTKGTQLSIYLPTHPSSNSQTLTHDTTRFKNALKKIKNNSAYNERELGKVVKSLQKLTGDVEFWKRRDVGLAILASSDGFDSYHVPYEITEATYIENRFVISPLVVAHSIGTEFYVLDVNLTKPRLLKSDHGTLTVINDENMPASFQDTVARDEYRAQLQHMAAPRGSGGDNRIHGHDGTKEALEHDTAEYLTLVADAVDEILVEQDRPLLLVGEQSRVGNLRPLLKYEHLLPQRIDGNFEMHTPQALYGATIELIQNNEADKRRALIKELVSSDPKLVVMGSKDIAQAARAGRVKRIYVPAYRRTTDSVRPGESESIILQLPSDISELESVIRDVLSQAGTVVAVEIGAYPELTETKALCRF